MKVSITRSVSSLVTGITSPHPLTLGGGGGAVERGKDKTEDGGWKEWRGAWGEKKGGWDLEWLIISRYYYRMYVVGLAVYFRQNRGKVDARPINVPRKKEQILSYSREKDKWLNVRDVIKYERIRREKKALELREK